jgi:hypothetical protein
MRTILLLPGALVEEADRDSASRALAHCAAADGLRRLQRARRELRRLDSPCADGAAHLQWLADAFGVTGDPPPTAPYAWRALGGDAAAAQAGLVWFCEPVHLLMGRERTVLTPLERPALTAAESEALRQDAADAAGQAGARIEILSGRWFLLTREAWSLQTIPLQAALGASVEARLPRGRDAARFKRLLNDVQMSWHASAVNRGREEAGTAAANGIWLHGGGVAAPLSAPAFAQSGDADPVLAGWRSAAATAPGPAADDARLVVFDGLFDAWWRKDWAAWAQAWSPLPSNADELVACGRRACARFTSPGPFGWLRSRSVIECLTEPS